jgi:hypothetical protein
MQVAVGAVYEFDVVGHDPSTDLFTVQVPEAVPPLIPAHVQVHGPVPETGEGLPAMQVAVGAV